MICLWQVCRRLCTCNLRLLGCIAKAELLQCSAQHVPNCTGAINKFVCEQQPGLGRLSPHIGASTSLAKLNVKQL